ncbi:hypothetical protein AQUCO_09500018v1 [Aquilegia coerulea]|nr:hypothetical protein AQUCO_09500018v1 [Aquilegia coerulea]PIA26259.1 hypothetical protein AQUCO_09500018v1 [Aquilegia coerulea]PIA26261.1 hypothetical protein AQUCO_09500018v1 [Aquilegia coerulea]
MGFLELLLTASMPVLEVLLVTALGLFIATESVGIFGVDARHYMNRIVFYVFTPAFVGYNLAGTVTVDSLIKMWFMPINILITFLLGSTIGWILIKLTGAPPHLRALILGVCSAGNLGNLLIVIIPAICAEPGNPFGDSANCSSNGLAYASLSMATGAIYIWSYVYNIMRVFSCTPEVNINGSSNHLEFPQETSKVFQQSFKEPLLSSTDYLISEDPADQLALSCTRDERKVKVVLFNF